MLWRPAYSATLRRKAWDLGSRYTKPTTLIAAASSWVEAGVRQGRHPEFQSDNMLSFMLLGHLISASPG